MKQLVIVDDHHSAIGLAAHSRFIDSNMEILAANEFMSPNKLLKSVEKRNPEVVFFAWRGALHDALISGSLTRRQFRKLNHMPIGMLIPDLMGLELESGEIESKLLDFVDYYLVTSKELYSRYIDRYPRKPPAGLYRDMPDLGRLHKIKNESSNPPFRRVIWVGNSKWGLHQGAKDHKGLNEIVIPLKNLLGSDVDFMLIDSSVERQPHEQVLSEIRDSQILIQTSKAEGTGLPLLEAAGLGRAVLTTEVGIASDFLTGSLRKLIVNRDVEAFSHGIEYALNNYDEISRLLQERFESYIEEISKDSLPVLANAQPKDFNLFSNPFNMLVKLKWFRRWLLAKQ